MTPTDLRELDRQCGEALGIKIHAEFDNFYIINDDGVPNECLPRYSTDPAACAILKQRLRDSGIWFDIGYREGVVQATAFAGPHSPEAVADTEEEAVARFFLACSEAGMPNKEVAA